MSEIIRSTSINEKNNCREGDKKINGNNDFSPIITSIKSNSIIGSNLNDVIFYEDILPPYLPFINTINNYNNNNDMNDKNNNRNNNDNNDMNNNDNINSNYLTNSYNNNNNYCNTNNNNNGNNYDNSHKNTNNEPNGANSKLLLSSIITPTLISTIWKPLDHSRILSNGTGLVPMSKHRIFPDIKLNYFKAVLTRSAARPARTEDDYEYPEDLPIVKINRFQSFRAKEASDILKLSSDDLMSSSLFCQLWMELKNVPNEKMRMIYSHPMDDGQSRTFKVR